MAKLRPPGLGPIVGHTTDISARIGMRAETDIDPGEHPDPDIRTVGVVGVTRVDGRRVSHRKAHYFRLRREFDRCGSIVVGADTPPLRLEPDTRYTVRMGYLALDDPWANDSGISSEMLLARLPKASAWFKDLLALDPRLCAADFTTFPSSTSRAEVSFTMGSCRYPGLLWKVRHSDRIFGPMLDHVEGRQDARAHFNLMLGDQIYADKLNRRFPFGRADSYGEFRERYLTAFGSPNLRRLMQRAPTYMAIDDHEIEDDWNQDRLHGSRGSGRYHLFTVAMDAFHNYQWSTGPRTWGKRLYYTFECGAYPFFVLDPRTLRTYGRKPEDLSDNHLLGRPSHEGAPPSQLDRLLLWLKLQQAEQGNVPKFIVTPGAFVPNPMSARTALAEHDPGALAQSDSWAAFPETRSAILRTIVESGVQNVVFLSGDIHCSNIAAIEFTGTSEAESLRAFSITSSAFYWPFPFADGEPSDFVHDSRRRGQEDTFRFELSDGRQLAMNYRAWNFCQEDNFTRVTIDPEHARLRVRVYDKRGRVVNVEDGDGGEVWLSDQLELKRW